MNLISMCLVIGVLALVKCDIKEELRKHDYIKLQEKQSHDTFPQDGWSSSKINMGNKKNGNPFDKDNEVETRKISELSFRSVDDERGKNENFAEGSFYLKEIYDQCKAKVNKRIKKLIKSQVKSTVNKYLFHLKEYVVTLYECMKVFGFRYLDEVLNDDFIPMTNYVYFMRDGTNITSDSVLYNYKQELSFSKSSYKSRETFNNYVANVLNNDWRTLIYERLQNLLKSHSLKFQLNQSHEGRSRRRDHRMFAMMVMGFMIMASILIPMGFQFLTVLGGKSLLMAKMALIMSAINGLKKIATSNVGYGFYHTGNDGHHHDHIHHGFHEKHFHVNSQNIPAQYGYNL